MRLITTLLKGHQKRIRNLSWSLDGRLLASGDDAARVCVWDPQRGVLRQSLSGHISQVTGSGWSEDGILATCGRDSQIIFWDLDRDRPGKVHRGSTALACMTWATRDLVLAGDEKGRVMAVDRGTQRADVADVHHHPSRIIGLGANRDQRWFAVAHQDGTVVVLDASFQVQCQVNLPLRIRGIAVHDQRIAICGEDPSVLYRTLPDLAPDCTLTSTTERHHCVTVSHDGEQIVAIGNRGKATCWTTPPSSTVETFSVPSTEARIHNAAFHPHQRVLAYVGPDPTTIQIVDRSTASPDQRSSEKPIAASTPPSRKPSVDDPKYDAFISYRRSEPDKSFARGLVRDLESAGYKVAIDERDFVANETFLDEMERCTRESRFTIAVISSQYFESGNTEEEAIIRKVRDMAVRKRGLIPVTLEKVSHLPIWL
ncbi:MAG: TIR domain-containing protein, partial [Planctomycetota bacterium]